jgi:hypothetical protein
VETVQQAFVTALLEPKNPNKTGDASQIATDAKSSNAQGHPHCAYLAAASRMKILNAFVPFNP